MKDAKGHGSDARCAASFNAALENYAASHQGGVNSAVPNVSGQNLYAALSGHVEATEHGKHFSGYSPSDIAGMEPDDDEFGNFKHISPLSGKMKSGL